MFSFRRGGLLRALSWKDGKKGVGEFNILGWDFVDIWVYILILNMVFRMNI